MIWRPVALSYSLRIRPPTFRFSEHKPSFSAADKSPGIKVYVHTTDCLARHQGPKDYTNAISRRTGCALELEEWQTENSPSGNSRDVKVS